MFTIVDRSGDEVRFRTDKGAWIKELYSGYNLCSYSDEIDAEIAKNNSGGNAISLAGKTTLKELITIINNAKFMLTNDTGPMHIAAALQVPVPQEQSGFG